MLSEEAVRYPQKKFFRSRAHCNPLANNDGFEYPRHPDERAMFFRSREEGSRIHYLDIGCGFGGLSVALAEISEDKTIVAVEIRPKVIEFVRRRILSLGLDTRVACIRTNAMIHLPHFIHKAEIEKIFFCFPDPHFKAKNYRRRIITKALLSEYAYFIQANGFLYAATDVLQLHEWHLNTCQAHPAFRILFSGSFSHESHYQGDYLHTDPFLQAVISNTEEAKKVRRAHNPIFALVAQRLPQDDILSHKNSFSNLNFFT